MTADEKRKEIVRLYKSRLRKNSYTQGDRRMKFFGYPSEGDPGYSDCSASIRAVYLRLLGLDIGGNTSAQVANRGKGILVEDNRDGSRSHPTPGKLKPGDCIYYKGTPGNTWDVGHVELHTGDNQCCGHGSGVGPTQKNEKSYSQGRTGPRKYLCTIRWIKDGGDEPNPAVKQRVKITGGTVNVRSGPSTAHKALWIARAGEIDESNRDAAGGWFGIARDGKEGWVSGKYAEIE